MAVRFDFDAPPRRCAFERGSEQLVLDHIAAAAILLTFTGARSQIMRFDDPIDAAFFQSDLETELVRTGWRLTIFESSPWAERQLSPRVTFA